MDTIAVGYLHAMTIAFSVYYTLRGLSYLYTFPEDVAALLGWPALAAAGISLGLNFWARSHPTNKIHIESAVLSLGVMLIFNVFWNFYLTGNQVQFVNAAFAMIAFGLGTATFWVWLMQILVCVGLYSVAVMSVEVEPWVPYVGLVLSGVILSLLAFVARAPIMRERVKLQLVLQEKAETLRQANESKDRFVANMTHELRTPLTGVMGMLDLLRDSKLDGDQVFLLQHAQKSARYLLEIVNDVLDFAKLEAGKLTLAPAPVDLLAVCREAVGIFDAQASEKGVHLNLKLPDLNTLMVMADGVRIGQVLMNLVGNALKFTADGRVDVVLEWVPEGSGGVARFSVTDTGAGIASVDIANLFRRFEQADNSATRTTTGTGLGLAICQDLVELMDGTIGVTSNLGHGSCFSFQINLAITEELQVPTGSEPDVSRSWRHPGLIGADENSDAHVKDTLDLPPETDAPGGKPRVLLAEDNPINQMVITRMLELEGLNVTVVDNGQEAVDAVHHADVPFDILFFDVQMPVMDGVNATKLIRLRMPAPPPIIAITANTLVGDVETYKEAGMIAVLQKPVVRDELRRVIKDILAASAYK